jgi:hypothetical protein
VSPRARVRPCVTRPENDIRNLREILTLGYFRNVAWVQSRGVTGAPADGTGSKIFFSRAARCDYDPR